MPDETRYYTWSAESRRYRSATTGRFVSRAAVRASLDVVIDVQSERVRALSADLVDGTVTLAEWRSEMSSALKIAHLEGASVARGGWLQLTTDDYSWLSNQRIRPQLGYLQRFHDDLAYGQAPLDGTVASRSAQYIAAGRATNRAMEGRMAADRGEEERNIGGDGDNSCDECIDCSDQGWVPIGTLPEVGQRTCGPNCHCWLDYRTGRTGEEG